MSKRKFQSGDFNFLGEGWGDTVISLDEWKRRKIIWEEENSRPNCKNCGKKLSAHFDEVLVQRYESIDYPKEAGFYGDEEEGEILHDIGVRQKPDYSKFEGFGHRNKGIFCTGRCCESFAYKVCDHFEGVA